VTNALTSGRTATNERSACCSLPNNIVECKFVECEIVNVNLLNVNKIVEYEQGFQFC